MSIATIYVKAKSKKAINEALATGADVHGIIYTPFDSEPASIGTLPNGTVVKIYDKVVSGSPYAKAYGNVARKPDGRVYVK